MTTQDHKDTAEDQIPRPSVFELTTIYTETGLRDERLTQHTLNPLATETADYDVSSFNEGEDDQESSFVDLENDSELSPLMLSYLDNRVVALVREEIRREQHGRQ